MSWIKDNKFVAGLAGGTLVGAALLYVVGSKGQSAYQTANDEFQTASSEVASYAKINPYPSATHRDAKQKSLESYRKDLESLQSAFDAYRPDELKNVAPEEFTNRLKAVNQEVRDAFKISGTKVPDVFYSGFEAYQGKLANGKATGILDYQLEGIKKLMLALSKANVGELKNLSRPPLAEESNGDAYQPKPGDVAQALPLEITFVSTEKAAREFLSAAIRLDDRFTVIRSIRVSNTKKDAPKTSDAKFDTAAPKPAGGAPKADDIFGGGFVLPEEEPRDAPKPAEGATAPATTPAPAPAPAAKPADSGRVLFQVLGNEEVQVFIRIDFLRFLPAKKLP
jgi:hypothetical protein